MSNTTSIFCSKTGELVKTLNMSDANIMLNMTDEQLAIEGDWTGHYLDTSNTLTKIPDRPSEYHTWDAKAHAWVATGVVDAIWDKIKAERDRRQLDCGVSVGGHWYQSNLRAQSEYTSMIVLADKLKLPAATVLRKRWRTMNGALVNMTPALALSILQAGVAQRSAVDDAAQVHLQGLQASAEPWTYDYTKNWPQTFDELETEQSKGVTNHKRLTSWNPNNPNE